MARDKVKLLPDLDYEFVMTMDSNFFWDKQYYLLAVDTLILFYLLGKIGDTDWFAYIFLPALALNCVFVFWLLTRTPVRRLGFKEDRMYWSKGYYECSEIELVKCRKNNRCTVYVSGRAVARFDRDWSYYDRFLPWAVRNGVNIEYED